MKTIKFTIICLSLCVLSSCAFLLGSPRLANDMPLAFRGEIMDSECARMRRHDGVERSKGITDSGDCVAECLKDGGELVLYSSVTGASYGLDSSGAIFDQDRLLEFAGERVRIVGSLDEDANRIWHIQSVERL
jgi:hypothetical protein